MALDNLTNFDNSTMSSVMGENFGTTSGSERPTEQRTSNPEDSSAQFQESNIDPALTSEK
jgi:hypothetical protein